MAKRFFPLLLLSILILIFFSRYLTGEKIFFAADEAASDLLDFYYPQRSFLAEHLKNNQIPLWTPYQQNGFPFLAEAQTGIFYPPNLILFKFLSTPLAFNWSIISAYFILAFGTYFFIKNLKLSNLSAFFGSLIIIFSGFFMGHLKHVPLLQAAVFLPWALLFIDNLVAKQQKKYVVLLSLTLTFSILAGHLPTAYSIILVCVLYFLLRLHSEFKETGESLKPILFFFLALLFAFLLSAIQLLPTIEMIPYSTRNAPISPSTQGNNLLNQIIIFINPYLFGDPSRGSSTSGSTGFWETVGYIGLLPLFLAIGSFFIKLKGATIFKVLLFASLLLAVGIPNGLFGSIWSFLPGLTFTRIPTRFLLFVDFSLAVLAAFVLEKIINAKTFEIRAISFIIILITIIDLATNFYGYNGSVLSKDWLQTPISALFLQKDSEAGRISNLGQDLSYPLIYTAASGWRGDNQFYVKGRETLPPTLNSLFKIPSIHFQYEYAGSFSLGRRTELSRLTQGANLMSRSAPKLLGLQNVKYILTLTLPPEATASYKIASQYFIDTKMPPVTILENPQVLPRAYLVQNKIVLPEAKILSFLSSDEFDPKSEVVLEKDIKLPDNISPSKNQTVKLLEEKENYLKYQVEATTSAFFVLIDSYYPGWIAKIDGSKVDILRANFAFRAIPIASGNHILEFIYKPKSFYLGAIISIISLVCLIIFHFRVWPRK